MANSTFLRSVCIYGISYCSAALQMKHIFFGEVGGFYIKVTSYSQSHTRG